MASAAAVENALVGASVALAEAWSGLRVARRNLPSTDTAGRAALDAAASDVVDALRALEPVARAHGVLQVVAPSQ